MWTGIPVTPRASEQGQGGRGDYQVFGLPLALTNPMNYTGIYTSRSGLGMAVGCGDCIPGLPAALGSMDMPRAGRRLEDRPPDEQRVVTEPAE